MTKKKLFLAAGLIILLPLLAVFLWCLAPAPKVSCPNAFTDLTGALPVFPGAQGFGTDTPAGRHGVVVRVTTLDDSGPGSLREALETPGPRVVVFEVGGVIHLRDNLRLSQPFATVAGETAPAPGVILSGAGLNIVTHNVLVRHLAIRVGDAPEGPAPDARDGISVYPENGGGHHVVVDHCSVAWAVDEGMSHWGMGVHDVTFSNCIVAEGLSHSIHPKGEHSKGMLLGDHGRNISVIGCLFAHNMLRNPFVKGDVTAIVANNLIYNPGDAAIHLGDWENSGPSWVSAFGNVLIPGPDTARHVALGWVQFDAHTAAYLDLCGNAADGRRMRHSWRLSNRPRIVPGPSKAMVRLEPLAVLPSGETESYVLAHAGSRPARRDSVDQRITDTVRHRTGKIIDNTAEAGGMPSVTPARTEIVLPGNPDSDDNKNGYTNLEEWLHQKSAELE